MGAGADAGIFAVAPVDEVVARFGAGAGMVRDLVGRQAVRRADRLRQVVEQPRLVVRWHRELAGPMQALEDGAGLDRELVEREMLGGMADRGLEFRLPVLEGLARPGVDQIEREALERLRRDGDGGKRLRSACAAGRAGEGPHRSGPARRGRRG